jgi:hypothetical protein
LQVGAKTAIALGGLAIGGVIAYLKRDAIQAWLVKRAVQNAMKKQALFGLAAAVETAPGVAMRQLRRYAFAASQDKSPIVGLTHASYALVLLDTLEEVAGRDAVRATGVDPAKIRGFITALQDKHAEALQACDPYMQAVLAMERSEGGQLPGFVMAGAGAAPRGA